MSEPNSQLDQLAHAVIGAAIEVHRGLVPGFLESVYEEALCLELRQRQIPFSQQHVIAVNYKGHRIGEGRLDILVQNCLIVELKAVEEIAPIHTAQLLSYLKQVIRSVCLSISTCRFSKTGYAASFYLKNLGVLAVKN